MYAPEIFPDVAGGYAADARGTLAAGSGEAGTVLLRLVGAAALALAFAGVFLPLLPTTPFVLVAAWAFARSEPRWNARLENHPRLGPPLRAWRTRQAVPRPAKAAAAAGLGSGWLILAGSVEHAAVLAAAAALMLAVGVYVLTRPS